jgi:hypothetical protein
MISESSFQNRSLSCSLYEAAIQRLQDALPAFLEQEFTQCQFGIVPGPNHQKMLFVITESCSQVERLSAHIEIISRQVERLMPGVARIALCIRPLDDGDVCENAAPRRVVGRIFELDTSEL